MIYRILWISLILAFTSPVFAQDTLYFSRDGSSVAAFYGMDGNWLFHAASSDISGDFALSEGPPKLHAEIDIRYMRFKNRNPHFHYTENVFQPHAYPKAVLTLDDWLDWPSGGLIKDTPDTLIASGTFSFHGVVRPVELPVALTLSAYLSGVLEGPVLNAEMALPFNPAEYGVSPASTWRKVFDHFELRLTLIARRERYLLPSEMHNRIWLSAQRIANQYGHRAITSAHIVHACLQLPAPASLHLFEKMEVSPDRLSAVIEAWLQEREEPKEEGHRFPFEPFAFLNRKAHQIAYDFQAAQAQPVYMLLAAIQEMDADLNARLGEHGFSHDDVLAAFEDHPRPAQDVQYLGNPFFTAYPDSIPLRYARNVWDMQHLDGKIYLGHGNSANSSPAVNPGPIPIVSYDIAQEQFAEEFVADEDQIDRFRVIDERIVAPGHDPTDDWAFGNYYQKTDGVWEKNRTIPNGIHTFDMLPHEGALFAALGTRIGAEIARSTDWGKTWETMLLPEGRRAFELFELNGSLFVATYFGLVYRYTGGGFSKTHAELFPNSRHMLSPLMVRSVPFDGQMLYIGADISNDQQWTPFGAYHAERIGESRRIYIPAGDKPYDTLVQGDTAYLLTNRFHENETVTVIIYASTDLRQWTETVRADLPSFARSFELINDDFYIGLGTTPTALNETAGQIYRITPPKGTSR